LLPLGFVTLSAVPCRMTSGRVLCRKLWRAPLKLYEGHFHDLLADVGKQQVTTDIQAWIERASGDGDAAQPTRAAHESRGVGSTACAVARQSPEARSQLPSPDRVARAFCAFNDPNGEFHKAPR
jgi:hypothetical protein